MSGDTGVCWCASDAKCPHKIQDKILGSWNEMEKSIDEILGRFDRRSIKQFLKRAPDGTEKPTTGIDAFKDKYGASLQNIVSKSAQGNPGGGKAVVHPLTMDKMRPGTAPEGNSHTGLTHASPDKKKGKKRKPLDPGMTPALELAEGEFVVKHTTNKAGYARRPNTSQASNSHMLSKSTSALPDIPGASRLPDYEEDRESRGRIGEAAFGQSTDKLDLDVAWSEAPANVQPGGLKGTRDLTGVSHIEPGDSAVAMGLMRIADVLSICVAETNVKTMYLGLSVRCNTSVERENN